MKNLKALRVFNGFTQGEIADEVGVNQSAVASWERGDTYPTADKLPKLARKLNCTIDALYADETEVKEAV